MSFEQLKNLIFYACNINGFGFRYLKNIETISIYQCPIIYEYVKCLQNFTHLKKINIYRCDYMIQEVKDELISVFGDKFNTD